MTVEVSTTNYPQGSGATTKMIIDGLVAIAEQKKEIEALEMENRNLKSALEASTEWANRIIARLHNPN